MHTAVLTTECVTHETLLPHKRYGVALRYTCTHTPIHPYLEGHAAVGVRSAPELRDGPLFGSGGGLRVFPPARRRDENRGSRDGSRKERTEGKTEGRTEDRTEGSTEDRIGKPRTEVRQ